MGHIRLGQLPRTRKWRDVVELVAVGADVSQVANATIRAADSAFSFVNNATGYNQEEWLMTQLGLAAGEKDPLKYLRSQGIDIPDNTSLPGVAAAITQALDNHSDSNGGHSALGELSQRALVDAVIQCMEPKRRHARIFLRRCSAHSGEEILGSVPYFHFLRERGILGSVPYFPA